MSDALRPACRATGHGLPRLAVVVAAALVLAACGSAPNPKPDAYAGDAGSRPRALPDGGATRVDALPPAPNCVPPREHDESLYTAGGLYAPGVADSAPPMAIDVSNIPEPVPRREPKSRYGNRESYTVLGRTYRVMPSAEGYEERGIASWYGYKFHGRHTSSRERYDMCAFTAAHKTLPLPSYVRVTNLDNGRSIVVRVNDRGPFHAGRIIDLSYAAATRLDMKQAGTARVEVRALMGPDGSRLADAVSPTPAPAAAPQRPSAPQPANRGSGPVPPPAGAPVDGPQVVQVGSFGDRDNAARLVARLRDAGFDGAQLDHAVVGERSVWRVRFPAMAAEAAAALVERIGTAGLAAPRMFDAEP
ncbi:MAG: septal ring lytic transglycosylase RlpA family protein [Silanimonas sp.]